MTTSLYDDRLAQQVEMGSPGGPGDAPPVHIRALPAARLTALIPPGLTQDVRSRGHGRP
jgi:hypothetical protein